MSSDPPMSLPEPPIHSAGPFSFRPPPPQSNRFLNPPDQNKVARRASRNFEDDLFNNSTIHLKSGTVDESKLGVFTPPFVRSFSDTDDDDSDVSPSMSRTRQPPNRTLQPPTPKVVPPTPDANSPAGRPVLFNDEEDREAGNKRRSLLRSPGTSSSPDLATLVRKARERGGVVGSRATEENKQSIPQVTVNESSPSSGRATTGNPSYLSPAPSGSRLRVTSSTSSFSVVGPPETPIRNMSKAQTFASRKIVKQQPSPLTSSVSNASQLSLLYQFGKDSGKSSMRSKTGAFFNKFIPQSSIRDKRRANSLTGPNSLPPPPSPRPPMPKLHNSHESSSSTPQPNDIFSPSSTDDPISPVSTGTPLPIHSSVSPNPEPETRPTSSLDHARVPSKGPRPKAVEDIANTTSKASRRRSMSVGDADMANLMASRDVPRKSGDSSNAPLRDWDLAMKDVIGGDDFSGAFKGLTSPFTPPRRPSLDQARQGFHFQLSKSGECIRDSSTMSNENSPREGRLSVTGSESLRLVSRPEGLPLPETPEKASSKPMPSPIECTTSDDIFLAPATPSPVTSADAASILDTTSTHATTPTSSSSHVLPTNEPRTPVGEQPLLLSPRGSSLRLPHRSPNPFTIATSNANGTSSPSGGSPSHIARVNTLRSYHRQSLTRSPPTPTVLPFNTTPSNNTASAANSSALPATLVRPSLDVAREIRRGSREFRSSRVQPRANASASEPALVSEKPSVSEDGLLASGVGGRDPYRTVRLVPSANSMLGMTERQSSTYSQPGSSSALSMASTTDLTSSRHPSSTRMVIEAEDVDSRAKELAAKCWTEDESFLPLDKIAEWLGGVDPVKRQALKYYMDYFDFTGLRLDNAFRHLCGKLYVRGETQQVDRILETFSARFWECNPSAIYHSPDVVHAISYSLLLLNTDLHVADISTHMSRNQFVRNTFAVIQPQVKASGSERPLSLNPLDSTGSAIDDDDDGTAEGIAQDQGSSSAAALNSTPSRHPAKKRSESLTSWKNSANNTSQSVVQLGGAVFESPEASRVSVNLPAAGFFDSPARRGSRDTSAPVLGGKSWEYEMDNLLKEMYASVKNQQILQPLSGASSSSLSPGSPMMRTRSQRGYSNQPDRINNLKRGSIRGLQSLLGTQSPYGSNSSSSVDGRISPSPSFATSIGEGVSVTSSTLFAPTLGFASNLSHSIIKETQEDDARSFNSVGSHSTNVSISDEELALLGPPWAKEGMLCRKQYWESSKRRAKSKTWMDVFVVIQKGELSMFTFGTGGTAVAGGGMGGGNWLANANLVGQFSLAHSLAHALPPPGYNRQRPHCFVLTLSSGAVFFFQAGTEDLVNEWVSTCNYWAARQSKEPLSGGVSNMEYGWSRLSGETHDEKESGGRDRSDTLSIRSGRSLKFGKISWSDAPNSMRSGPHTLPADRIYIHDWKPPLPPSVPSTHDEETQLESLQKQVALLKKELKVHNELRQPMQDLYSARSLNTTKALSNWEQKSQYLLAEIIKYESYVESLRQAMNLRLKKRGEKVLEKALVHTPDDDYPLASPGGSGSGRIPTSGKTLQHEETIHEIEEPPIPGSLSGFTNALHRRETAGDE